MKPPTQSVRATESQPTTTCPGPLQIGWALWHLTWRNQLSWRQSPVLVLHILGLPLLGYLRASSLLSLGGAMLFTIDLYTYLALPLFCLNGFGGLMRDDLQEDTACYILTRPIRRWQFLIGRYGSQALWTWLIATLTYGAFGCTWWILGMANWLPAMLALMIVAIPTVLVYGAISALLGLLTRKYLVLGLIYGFVIEFGVGQIPTNLNSLSMTNHLKDLLALYPEIGEHLARDPEQPWLSLSLLLVATLLSLGASCLLFSHREYLHAEEMTR